MAATTSYGDGSCASSAIPASETLFVGFWTNQGVADQKRSSCWGS